MRMGMSLLSVSLLVNAALRALIRPLINVHNYQHHIDLKLLHFYEHKRGQCIYFIL